ncbi:hypothetical protein CYPRO_1653 [Cyclonatronum proteinivorum]|uniref:Uncharacterized protein n=1 Tax=Cyclonatronum proteinivorum TaxID=1457365 RepID=A0A345UKA2_9BACT|nr:hypothetical protein [Cyclonatronum proteinivorum]AXJ00904.1 hypothetical protein CYPRO_1653 [Cyclonatronum proteinivorum]
MSKKESITIRVNGRIGEKEISPELFDISDIRSLINDFENMLFPDSKKKRPPVSYMIEKGSVVNTFTTSRQEVLGFQALLIDVQKHNSLDLLELKSAAAFENLQRNADETNLTYEISTSLAADSSPLIISPNTAWKRTDDIWVDAEFYVYGEITNAGGKNNSNIHVDTKEYGILTIATDRFTLKEKEENILYNTYGVRVKGKQHIETGEMDPKSLRLIELINMNKKYDENYLESLIAKATPRWEGIDAEEWLNELRGTN